LAFAASKREGWTSVACIDADASSRTTPYGPLESDERMKGRARAMTIAASAAICSSNSTLGGTLRQGRCDCKSLSAASHKNVDDTRRAGRFGRSKYVARIASSNTPPKRNAAGAKAPMAAYPSIRREL